MQFNYETYVAQQEANKKEREAINRGNNSKTHFVNEYLKNDGDSVIVRFPYHSMEDIQVETTHLVTFPGDRFGKRVRCEGADCPLCKQGVKIDTRVFVKAIVYVPDPTTGKITLIPAIWDRPKAFADIELKNKMMDYGDLTESLFKVKRNGTGTDTRYSIDIVTNKAVYNPEVYKEDFTGLDEIDASRILTKSIEQYMTALNPDLNKEVEKPVYEAPVEQKTYTPAQPVVEEPVVEPTPVAQPTQVTSDRPRRYTF